MHEADGCRRLLRFSFTTEKLQLHCRHHFQFMQRRENNDLTRNCRCHRSALGLRVIKLQQTAGIEINHILAPRF